MRAENEYLKKLWALQRGEENVSKIAQYAVWWDQLSFKGYSILMLCEIVMYPEVGFTNGSEDVVRLLVNNWRINS
ncbi:hypothetical protein P7H25_19835 [Paenibacillus larvae]|nr:hypothetical protein [Paenibacillus larvae]MDT2257348.1 hypothetical protein [Paenibacillus larvae]